MEINFGAKFKHTHLREICSNIDEVLKAIKEKFPLKTNSQLARLADVCPTTVKRWISIGRAEAKPVRTLLEKLRNESDLTNLRLIDANPNQLYEACCIAGWDMVIKGSQSRN